jgi:hypothetical protein
MKHTAFAWLQLRKIQTEFRVTGHLVRKLKREETNTHAAWGAYKPIFFLFFKKENLAKNHKHVNTVTNPRFLLHPDEIQ